MARLNQNQQQEKDGSDDWLMSYADMMTLIACFFILLIAFANFDPVGFTEKTKEVAQHFNKDKFKSSKTEMEELKEEVANHPEVKTKSKVSVKSGELQIVFSGSALFEGQKHTLSEESAVTLDTMIDIIKTRDPNYRILVEGHTDNTKPTEESHFSSNWALSGARAASVIERFELYGFDPSKLVAIGMSDTKPLVPNEDEEGNPLEENRKINRRVVIKVLEPSDKSQMIKMGLGVYFKDSTEQTEE